MGCLMDNNSSDACFPTGGDCVSAGQHNVNMRPTYCTPMWRILREKVKEHAKDNTETVLGESQTMHKTAGNTLKIWFDVG